MNLFEKNNYLDNQYSLFSLKNSYQNIVIRDNYLENNFMNIFNIFIENNTNIVEAGSCIGRHTVILSKTKNINKVYAFEANPNTFMILCSNLYTNACYNIIPINKALGDKNSHTYIEGWYVKNLDNTVSDGEKRMFNIGGAHCGNIENGKFIRNDKIEGIDSGYSKIELVTLDSLNIDNVSFMKVDIEMCEYEFLCGAEKTIEKNRPFILIEITNRENTDNINVGKKSFDKLESMQYIIFNAENFIEIENYVEKNNYSQMDAICIPKEKLYYSDDKKDIIIILSKQHLKIVRNKV